MNDLPNWVWDLVIALSDYEEIHGNTGPDSPWICLAAALDKVPSSIQDQAEAIAKYLRHRGISA